MKTRDTGTLICALSLLAATSMAGEIDEKRAIAPDATVYISNVAGDIGIGVWDRSEVWLTGELGNHQKLEITESSQGIQFQVRNIEGEEDYDEAELKLLVPAGASIVAEAVSADIDIDGCTGESLTAESVSGDIHVTANVARAELSSVSGDIEFKGSSRRIVLEAVSGDIEAAGVEGEISVSTVSGDVSLVAGSVTRGQFETVSGTLELRLAAAQGARVNVESMNGDVFLNLPQEQEGEFSAQTFSGDIRSAHGEVKHDTYGPGSHLKHVAGQSGATIRVESFSGDIHIGHL